MSVVIAVPVKDTAPSKESKTASKGGKKEK